MFYCTQAWIHEQILCKWNKTSTVANDHQWSLSLKKHNKNIPSLDMKSGVANGQMEPVATWHYSCAHQLFLSVCVCARMCCCTWVGLASWIWAQNPMSWAWPIWLFVWFSFKDLWNCLPRGVWTYFVLLPLLSFPTLFAMALGEPKHKFLTR